MPQAWPKQLNAAFTTLRAEGAFLVSATGQDGRVQALTIFSERGQRCRVALPWPGGMKVLDATGQPVETTLEPDHIISLATVSGQEYQFMPVAEK